MWLSNPAHSLSALVADWPCRAILTEFVKTCSVVFEGHFEFYVQVIASYTNQLVNLSLDSFRGVGVEETVRDRHGTRDTFVARTRSSGRTSHR